MDQFNDHGYYPENGRHYYNNNFQHFQSRPYHKPKFVRQNNQNLIFRTLSTINELNEGEVFLTWSILLKTLDITGRDLPPNLILVMKIETTQGDEFHVVRDETKFKILRPLCHDQNYPFTVYVLLVKREDQDNEDSWFIERTSIPNQINFCFHVPNRPNTQPNVKSQKMNKSVELFSFNYMKAIMKDLTINFERFQTLANDILDQTNENDSEQDHGIECSFCSQHIIGLRYCCQTCKDYNLCQTCDSFSVNFHEESHDFIRIRKPKQPSASSGRSVQETPDLKDEKPKKSKKSKKNSIKSVEKIKESPSSSSSWRATCPGGENTVNSKEDSIQTDPENLSDSSNVIEQSQPLPIPKCDFSKLQSHSNQPKASQESLVKKFQLKCSLKEEQREVKKTISDEKNLNQDNCSESSFAGDSSQDQSAIMISEPDKSELSPEDGALATSEQLEQATKTKKKSKKKKSNNKFKNAED